MSLFKATPRAEQETVFNYDNESSSWFISTDVPKHIRKYEPLIDNSQSSSHKDALGNTVYLEGSYLRMLLFLLERKEKCLMNRRKLLLKD